MTRAVLARVAVLGCFILCAGCSDDAAGTNNDNQNHNLNNNNGNQQEPVCGDRVQEAPEECDGNDLGEASCESLGFVSGYLACHVTCRYDTSGCQGLTVCGDGEATGSEECDGEDLRGETCHSLYGLAGDLACDSCLYDDRGCHPTQDVVCDVAGGETQENAPSHCGFQQVSVGGSSVCGVRNDGSLWCWGNNSDGQLGDGTQDPSTVPVQVLGLADVRYVSTGHGDMYAGAHSCAIAWDRTVWCWGANFYGQLGQGAAFARSATPLQVVGLTNVELLAVGGPHACAVVTGGDLYCWGGNDFGQLGIDSTDPAMAPVQVTTLSNVTDISANSAYYGNHTCAISGGQIYCWGGNRDFNLGVDSPYTPRLVPTLQVQQSAWCSSFVQVSAGHDHGCGLTSQRNLCCWGRNGDQQTMASTDPPGSQVPPAPVSAYQGLWDFIDAAAMFTCGRLASGPRVCYGFNDYGSLGLGFTSENEGASPVPGFGLTGPISAGGLTACATKSDTSLWCWGENSSGQLGNGSSTDSATPIPVAF